MTHLKIQQKRVLDGGSIENVSSAVITALYNIANDDSLVSDLNDLEGDLHVPGTYLSYIDALHTKYPKLNITADSYYMYFVDPVVELICANNWGSNGSITASLAAAVTSLNRKFLNNTDIQTFDELRYFTSVTSLNLDFEGCTNLTSVDLSNITSLGLNALKNTGLTGVINLPNFTRFYNRDVFRLCTGITEVNFGPTLMDSLAWTGATGIFSDCTNLVKVTGLSSLTGLPSSFFYNCEKLSDIDIDFSKFTQISSSCFRNCKNLSMQLDTSNVTNIETAAFSGCIGLTSVDLTNVTQFGLEAFLNCSLLSSTVNLDSIVSIGSRAFNGCLSLNFSGVISLTNYPEYVFANCKKLTGSNIDFSTCITIQQGAFMGSGLSGKLYLPLCTSISRDAFVNVGGITEVDAPELISIHREIFLGCTQISKISIPKVETELRCNGFNLLREYNAPKQKQLFLENFKGCTSLTTLVLDFGEITDIPKWAFQDCSALSGTLDFAKVTSIGTEIFKNCTFDVIFRTTTFPTLIGSNQMGGFKGTLYVDDSLLIDYQTQFPDMDSRIKGISELPS